MPKRKPTLPPITSIDFDKYFQEAANNLEKNAVRDGLSADITGSYLVWDELSPGMQNIIDIAYGMKYNPSDELAVVWNMPTHELQITDVGQVYRSFQLNEAGNLERMANVSRGFYEPGDKFIGSQVEKSFQNASDIADKIGLFGGVEGDKQGMLDVYQQGNVMIPWVTAGDDTVCEDCQQLADESPYSADSYPEPPHFGCRCEPGDPEVVA